MENNKKLHQELKDALVKHMPEAVAGALKERLSNLEEIEVKYTELLLQDEKNRLELDKLRNLELREKSINNKEIIYKTEKEEFSREKIAFENEKLIYKLETNLEAEKSKAQHAMELNMGLVRNTVYRNSTMETLTDSYTDATGYSNSTQRQEPKYSTKTEE